MSDSESENIVNPVFNLIRKSAGMRMAVLFGSFFLLLIVASFLADLVVNLPWVSERDHLLWGSLIQNVIAFCIPAYLVAKFSDPLKPFKWLNLTSKFSIKTIIGVLIVYIISLPSLEYIVEWNNNIQFPEGLEGVEATLRTWENNANGLVEILLQGSGFWGVFAGVMVIGVVTGFSEELFFRGGVQGIFIRANIGVSASVWIAAIIFSALHFQFFGFIPRLLMGVFFGYLVVWTKDIKISMFAHILNNSIVVITQSIWNTVSFTTSESSLLPETNTLWIISLLCTVIFFLFFKDYFFKESYKISFPWQKKPLHSVIEK